MAFMGLMVAGIFLMILATVAISALVLFIVGITVRKKHKRISNVLFVFSIINTLIIACVFLFMLMPKSEMVETKEGRVKLKAGWILEYKNYLESNNIEGMSELITKHPEMIYYYDVNRVTLLDYGMYNLNVGFMEIAIENGAVFDDPLTYDHLVFENSADSFFLRLGYPKKEGKVVCVAGVTTDDMLETVEFMINNGAALRYEQAHDYEYQNFYEDAYAWVTSDGSISNKDTQLLELIESNMQ